MPIIKKVTRDMFSFSDVCTHMVNPVNLVGVPGAGLALEFRRQRPEYVEIYKEAIRDGTLKMGTLQVIPSDDVGEWDIMNIPTKRHFSDTSKEEDLRKGIEALRKFLLDPNNDGDVIGLPMLGCGLGQADYATVLPMYDRYLANLSDTVFVSMSPDRTEERPRYLLVSGPPGWGNKPEERETINTVIDQSMKAWGTTWADYEGVVGGGINGVETYVSGPAFGQYENTLGYEKMGKPPLVCYTSRKRYGLTATSHQINLLTEIGHDIILFKPPKFNNNRATLIQRRVKHLRDQMDPDDHPKRISVWGDRSMDIADESVKVR